MGKPTSQPMQIGQNTKQGDKISNQKEIKAIFLAASPKRFGVATFGAPCPFRCIGSTRILGISPRTRLLRRRPLPSLADEARDKYQKRNKALFLHPSFFATFCAKHNARSRQSKPFIPTFTQRIFFYEHTRISSQRNP